VTGHATPPGRPYTHLVLDVRRLRVLREVATRGSMSAAAEALSYTPSAISQQIAALEREAGTALLERGRNSLTLTPAGEMLVEETEHILAHLEAAEAKLATLVGGRGGELRVGSFVTGAVNLMPDAIQRFTADHPDVLVRLIHGEPEDYLPLLRSGELDLALTLEYDFVPPLPRAALKRMLLLQDPMWVLLPATHPAAGDASVALADLAGEPWIVELPTAVCCHRFTIRACEAAGFEPRVAYEAGDYALVRRLVGAGLGVALVPALVARSALADDVVALPVTGRAPSRRVYAVHPTNGSRPASVSAMLRALQRTCADYTRDDRLSRGATSETSPQKRSISSSVL
jgi:DNA-binding transcriptional LysR family regulator